MAIIWIFVTSLQLNAIEPPFTWRVDKRVLNSGETGALIIGTEGAVKDLSVKLGNTLIPTFSCPKKLNEVRAFLPVSLAAMPGTRKLKFTWKEGEILQERSFDIPIKQKQYQVEKLTVAPKRVDLGPKEVARVALEAKVMKRIYESPREIPQWLTRFDFKVPINSQVTSPFGTRRNFNGRLKSFHTGVDLRGNESTKVVATHQGEVRAIKSLFFAGTTVVVDHGLGVFSIYSHLSKVLAVVGDKIKRGEVLGFVGKSGRVTAPHLHWGFKVHGVAVSPMQFLEVAKSVCG